MLTKLFPVVFVIGLFANITSMVLTLALGFCIAGAADIYGFKTKARPGHYVIWVAFLALLIAVMATGQSIH